MKYFLSILFIGLALKSQGQTQKDFESFGKLVFEKLITPEDYNTVDLMWVSRYRDFLKAQDFESEDRTERELYRMDHGYEKLYLKYQESVNRIKSFYNKALEDGAQVEYLETFFTPLDRYKDLYAVDMSFVYTTYNIQNEVHINFEVVWYMDFFWLITPFKEEF